MNIKISTEYDNSQIPIVARLVRHLCVVCDIGNHPSVNKIEVATVELLTNIIKYAERPSAESLVEVHCSFEGGDFHIIVSEPGKALSERVAYEYTSDTVSMPEADIGIMDLPESGFGIQIIKSVCDDLHYKREKGLNVFTMAFDLSSVEA